jgi:YD repeat-containing protein
MRQQLLTRSKTLFLVFLMLIATLPWGGIRLATPGGEPQTRQEALEAFQPYVDYLNEFTERRRLKVYFANEQSIFYGTQAGYVNVGRGNFTFARRDLVTVGRIPLELARVYDSSFEGGPEFGRGWRLSAAETIQLQPDGSAVLLSESAAIERFLPSGDGFVQAQPCPTDIVDFRRVDARRFHITLRTGFVKEYTLTGDLYRLTRVEDRNGNAVVLEYSGGKLARLRGQNNRLIRLDRDRNGRVASIRDDQGRSVYYRSRSRPEWPRGFDPR